MFSPDDSEPLNPVEDGSGYYNKLADSPELSRYDEAIVTNKGFSDNETDKRATLLTKTPVKQNTEQVDEQYSKKGTPKRKTQRTPAKLRFNVTETQASPAAKKSNTTKHTRSASTGQQYVQPSPPPSPKFKHPYQQLKGGDAMENSDAEQSTGYANIAADESPRLNNFDASTKISSDSPAHIDIGSPVTSFFKEAIQSTQQSAPQSKHPVSTSITAVNPSFAVASSMVTETPVSMVTMHATGNVWGASPQKAIQQEAVNMAPSSEWIVSAELREKFKIQFQDLKPENNMLFGEKARVFFMKSKLQSKDLSAIWKLADIDKDGKLSEEEFCIAMKMVLVRRKGYDIPSTVPEQLLPTKPLSHSTFPTSTTSTHEDSSHLPALPALQQHQLKSQTLPIGMKPPASKYPAQLPWLPPPSRKQFNRTTTGGSLDSPVTSRFNGNDELSNSPTGEHTSSRIIGLSHSNWPSALTSDSGKPLKFDTNAEHSVPLPQTPTDAPYCPVDSNNMENNVASSNKHKKSAPLDIGPKPEMVQSSVNEQPVKQTETAAAKTKIALVPISKDDSGDDDNFDSEGDETSALYAVVKPRGNKGKSNESKTHKHSTLRSSNSFKKHRPKPPPKPEPYISSKYKKKSSSPPPVPPTDHAAPEESGYVDPSTLDVQEQANNASANITTSTVTAAITTSAKTESSVSVEDPTAVYAKVIKKKPSMDLMEPIPLGQDIVPLQKLVERNVIPPIAVSKDCTESSVGDGVDIPVASTTASFDASETTDGIFGHVAAQLVSVATSNSTNGSNSSDKPIPMPRKKHHRSSSLDLNKMFQKRKSAEQLAVSPDSLTKDLPSAVPPKPPPKPRKALPVKNENELVPQISRSASLDSINSAAGNVGMVNAHLQMFEKTMSRTPPVQRGTAHDDSQQKKKKPLLPPHLRQNQLDTQPSKSDSSGDIVSGSNQEHVEKRDKHEIQKNIKALKDETTALTQLNQNLQQMLMRLMEERTLLQAKLDASTKHHTVS